MTPIASNWGYIDGTINLTFWITGAGYVVIILFMAYCVFRFRHQEGRRAAYQPENNKLEWSLGIGTTVAVLALLGPGLFVWYQYIAVPKEASEFEVVGQQWQLELSPSGEGRPARHIRSTLHQFRQSLGFESERSRRARRSRDRRRRLAPARSGSRSRYCSAPSTSCTTFMCPSSGPRWTRCQVWSPTSGSPRPEPGRSKSSARHSVASVTMRCGAMSSLRRRATIRRGCRSSIPSRNYRLTPKK